MSRYTFGASRRQTVRLLGPLRVNYVDLQEGGGNYVLMDSLEDGSSLLGGWAVLVETFDTVPIGAQMTVLAEDLAFSSASGDVFSHSGIDQVDQGSNIGKDIAALTTTYANSIHRFTAMATDTLNALGVTIFAEGDEPTQGKLDFYAVIADPV